MLGKKRKGKMLGAKTFFFPSYLLTVYMWWRSPFLEMAEHLPSKGKQWIHSLFCFVCVNSFYFFPIKLMYVSQPMTSVVFAFLTLLVLSPIPPWGKSMLSCAGLTCQLGLNHNRCTLLYLLHLLLKLKTLRINYAASSSMCLFLNKLAYN